MKKPILPEALPTWGIGLIIVATVIAYNNSFAGTFVFDDHQAITENSSIHHLWPIWAPFLPPGGLTVGGRPLINFSFAINYAVCGLDVWSYHALNLLIHILAALTLFGLVRRTLLQPSLQKRFGTEANFLAIAVALLWSLNPLQTESVTYISQRAESLMGLFYLLTLYCLVRAAEPEADRRLWSILCVTACLLGMTTKEIMVTAPLMALLFDRTFLAGSFLEAWRQRKRLYLGLAATWLVLLLLFHDIRQRQVGPGMGITPWIYALTECPTLVHYLRLMLWPQPLVFDYGSYFIGTLTTVLPQATLVVALLIATIVAFFRWPRIGFAGVWFFVILAPTSSFLPILLSPTGEHRLYLPLAATITLEVLGLHLLLGKNSRFVFLALAVVWGVLTFQRNEDYRSSLALWSDTVTKVLDNERAHYNDGVAYMDLGRLDEASAQFQEALRINPLFPDAHNNWGRVLLLQNHVPEAIAQFQEAVRLNPNLADAQNNWGVAVLKTGPLDEASAHFQEALRLNPNLAEARGNWGIILARTGHPDEAAIQFQEVLRLNPNQFESHLNWGIILAGQGHTAEAIVQFQEALRIKPNDPNASARLARLQPSTR